MQKIKVSDAAKRSKERSELLGEIKRLKDIVAWCRPRLSNDIYRGTLDGYMAAAPTADHTKLVQSEPKHHAPRWARDQFGGG